MTDSPYLNPIEIYICIYMDVFLAFIEWDSEESTGRERAKGKGPSDVLMRRLRGPVDPEPQGWLCKASELVQAACGVILGQS